MYRSLSFIECPLRELGQDACIVHDTPLFVLNVSPSWHIGMQPFLLMQKRCFPKLFEQIPPKAKS